MGRSAETFAPVSFPETRICACECKRELRRSVPLFNRITVLMDEIPAIRLRLDQLPVEQTLCLIKIHDVLKKLAAHSQVLLASTRFLDAKEDNQRLPWTES